MAFPLSLAALGLVEFAPMLGNWFGGSRTENIASRVTDIAKKLTGMDDIPGIIANLRDNPEKARMFQKELYAMETEVELSLIHDRQEARKRDAQLLAATGKTNRRADIMVVSAVLGLGVCLSLLCFFSKEGLPGEAVAIISTISGIFGACLKDAYSFEFGSSKGSRQKDENMAAIIDQL